MCISTSIYRDKISEMELGQKFCVHWWLMPVILATQETDQEDRSSKRAWANSFQVPISKLPNTHTHTHTHTHTRRDGGVLQV
jgi:hypothetical protein